MLGKNACDKIWKFVDGNGDELSVEKYPVNQVISLKKSLREIILGIQRPHKVDVTWVLINADPVFDDEKNIEQVIVTFMDVTTHTQIEKALKKSKDRYSNIFDNAAVSIWDEDFSEVKKDIDKQLQSEDEENEDKVEEIIIEIRAGTGGEEAALFAADLFDMYKKFGVLWYY